MSGLDLSLRTGLAPPVPAQVSPYAVETRAVATRWAALGVTPGDARVALIDDFIRALKATSVYTKLDLLYLWAAHADLAARVNLVKPGTFDTVPTFSPTFTADRGYTGDGTAAWLATGFNPLTAPAPKMVKNSLSVGVYSLTDGQSNGFEASQTAGGGTFWIRARSTANQYDSRIGDDGSPALSAANTGGIGLFTISRTGATARAAFKNATQVAADAEASMDLASSPLGFLRRSTTYSPRQVAMGFAGAGLTSGEVAALAPIVDAYLQGVGAIA